MKMRVFYKSAVFFSILADICTEINIVAAQAAGDRKPIRALIAIIVAVLLGIGVVLLGKRDNDRRK